VARKELAQAEHARQPLSVREIKGFCSKMI
jgi:hypothetical protein